MCVLTYPIFVSYVCWVVALLCTSPECVARHPTLNTYTFRYTICIHIYAYIYIYIYIYIYVCKYIYVYSNSPHRPLLFKGGRVALYLSGMCGALVHGIYRSLNICILYIKMLYMYICTNVSLVLFLVCAGWSCRSLPLWNARRTAI